ncbi:MAG: type II secretion system F family protein [Candidatus Eisenbacteria sp.]|nr:type II secretion system F family protein [Candidatus Eisenbacteria bacterium]
MSVFAWKGRTVGGEVRSGEVEAETRTDAAAQLRRKRIVVNQIKPKRKELSFSFSKGKGRVKSSELAIFTRQFSTMIDSGLPLVQCLDILSKQTERAAFRAVITDVMHDVEAGTTLAEALAKQPHVFDTLYVNMVDAGEAGGILDKILGRLATYIEKAEALKRKVKSAMTYPAVVFCVAGAAMVFMLLVIIPVFADVFANFGGQLPLPTRIVVSLSDFVKSSWWIIGGFLVGAIFSVKRYRKTEQGARRIDAFMLRIPVMGDLVLKSSIARFTRTLGTMISSGVAILAGLDVTARTAGNKIIEDAIQATKASIREGETIAEPLRAAGVFPPMVVQMIAVGEETGALDKMLEKIANFYDDEVNTAVDTLTSIIEPVMIVVMGVMVGGMVVAMYLPMFKLINVVAGSG